MENNYIKIPQKVVRSKNFKYIGIYSYIRSYVNLDPSQEFYKNNMLVSWPGYSKIRSELWGIEGKKRLGSTNTIKTQIDEIVKLGWIKLIVIKLKNGKTKHIYHLGNLVNGKQVYFIDQVKDVSKNETSDVSKSDTSLDVSKTETSIKDVSKSDTSFNEDVSKSETWMSQKVRRSKDQYSIDQDPNYISKDLHGEDSEDRTSHETGIVIKKEPIKKAGPKPKFDPSQSYRRKGAICGVDTYIPAFDPVKESFKNLRCNDAVQQNIKDIKPIIQEPIKEPVEEISDIELEKAWQELMDMP